MTSYLVVLVQFLFVIISVSSQQQQHQIYSKLPSNFHQNVGKSEDSTGDLLLKINDKLTEILVLDEQQLKRIEALEYKINRIEVTHQERNDVIRLQMQELTRKVANLDYVASKIESTLEGVKTEVESLKDLDRFSRNSQPDQYAASASSSVSGSSAVVPEKLNSLAVLTTSVASAVNRIEREIHIMSRNTTQLMQSVNYLQRNVPTKQYLNTAILGLKNQPIYAVMQSSPSEVTSLTSSSSGNQSIPTNCKYAVRRFGVTKIQLFSNNMREPFFVNCIDGWTVIQNRDEGGVSFYRNWAEYKHGFGNIGGEFWIGLEKLYELTSSRIHEILIEMEDFEGVTRKAKYTHFAIGSEKENFALVLLGKYSGDAGDAMSYHAGQKFSTFDLDNDSWPEGNCAQAHTGAWWFNACDTSNLNGRYLGGETPDELRYQGIYWQEFKGSNYSLKKSRMMIRPID